MIGQELGILTNEGKGKHLVWKAGGALPRNRGDHLIETRNHTTALLRRITAKNALLAQLTKRLLRGSTGNTIGGFTVNIFSQRCKYVFKSVIENFLFIVEPTVKAIYKTLPKAQRTRGLSSSYQCNFLRSYHKFEHKS